MATRRCFANKPNAFRGGVYAFAAPRSWVPCGEAMFDDGYDTGDACGTWLSHRTDLGTATLQGFSYGEDLELTLETTVVPETILLGSPIDSTSTTQSMLFPWICQGTQGKGTRLAVTTMTRLA